MIRDFTIQVLQYISLFNTQVFVIHLCSSITFKICYMFPLVFFFLFVKWWMTCLTLLENFNRVLFPVQVKYYEKSGNKFFDTILKNQSF